MLPKRLNPRFPISTISFPCQIELLENIGLVVLGKPEVIRLAVVALLAEGHVLIEDVPGVGKTLLARALAASIDCSFRRIQFTPDLLPSDVLGSSIYHAPSGEFVFKPGPLFANVILADEINRTTPRTQSALLEAMSDRQVSIEGTTYPLHPRSSCWRPRIPYEFEGTYVLPESQLDRFMLRLRMGYPLRIRGAQGARQPSRRRAGREPGAGPDRRDVLQLQRGVRTIQVDDAITDYLLDIVHATRRSDDLHVGVSTRGADALPRGAEPGPGFGPNYVVPDDIKTLVVPVLAHRVVGQVVSSGGRVRSGRGDHPRHRRPHSRSGVSRLSAAKRAAPGSGERIIER